jgi:hypothetical protein
MVLVSLGVGVARWDTPFAVAGRRAWLAEPFHVLLDAVCRGRLARLDRALMAYDLTHAHVPGTLDELVSAGLVDASHLKDPWARPFHYALTERGYLLSAVDAQGKTEAFSAIERVLPPERP